MKQNLFILFILITASTNAQVFIRGRVLDGNSNTNESIPGANIRFLNNTHTYSTDADGRFVFNYDGSFPITLITSFTGFTNDTLFMEYVQDMDLTIRLKKSITLKPVEIQSKRESVSISTITPINTTTISGQELLKAACCNLSESFETNPTVDVNYADAVTGAKQIQLLGLDGIYSQIQSENLPLIKGLSAAYGLSFTPGPWIESIQINKGVGSVINGYEAITGQLNIELKKPQTAERLFVNGYVNNDSRKEINLQVAQRFRHYISGELLVHGSNNNQKIDHDKDGFLDQPLTQQLNLYQRWHVTIPNKLEAQAGVRALIDQRKGGQAAFNYSRDYGKATNYGIGIENKLFEFFTKTGTINAAKPHRSFALITSARLHVQDNFYGLKTYIGDQRSFYANTIYQTIIKDTKHYIRTGVSFNYNHYTEKFNNSPVYTNEIVPGVYGEYTYNNFKDFALVAGIRGDYLDNVRAFITPRVHIKYNFNQLTSLRLSSGTGWRTARIYAENTAVFVSSRTIVLINALKPEQAWNSGINFTKKFMFMHHEAAFNVDYYYTRFLNQVVVDMEDVHTVQFYNLTGKSYAHYLQGELNVELFHNVNTRLAYKYTIAKMNLNGNELTKPFTPKDKALLNIEYKTENKNYSVDYTLKYTGISRIPGGGINHHGYEIEAQSKRYLNMNAQVNRKIKNWNVYLGVENLTNFRQHHAIVAADNPFGDNFDASLVWGPLMGRTFYAGFRFTIQ
jgi:outer membrane receptor for ferrienterochelin and colicin